MGVGRRPIYLKVLLEPLLERVGDLVELVKLPDPLHGRVVAGRPAVQTLDDGGDVTEDTGVHQGCRGVARILF